VRLDESASDTAEYKVGKNRPPLHTRFKKGDGRKRPGRPSARKNIGKLIMDAASDTVIVTIEGKKRRISKAQSAVIQLANAAATGDHKSAVKLLNLIADIEARAEAARPSEYPFSDVDKNVIGEIYERLRSYDERAND